MSELAPLPALDPGHLHIGADPRVIRSEIEAIIADAASNAPRSLQREIGPSEIGTPCLRKLASRLVDAPEVNDRDAWRPTVGTATHTWIAEALAAYNEKTHEQYGFSRYLIECRVMVGVINGAPIFGSADCYDRVTCEVIDWKIVGTTTLKTAKRAGPMVIHKPGYRTQAHLYGRGFELRGLPVHGVNIAYLPSSGEMREAFWQREPYNATVARDAIMRANAIAVALAAMEFPEPWIATLPRVDDMCSYCTYYNPAAAERFVYDGCTGARRAGARESLVTELIGEGG